MCVVYHRPIYAKLKKNHVYVLILFSNISTEDQLYTEADLEESMSRIETINFHEEKVVNGIRFWCYHAGANSYSRAYALFTLECRS